MNILIISGSNREISSSKTMCMYIQKHLLTYNHEVIMFDLYDHPLPIYKPDDDFLKDNHLMELKERAVVADAFVLSTPEYHGGMSGILKNSLDYLGSEQFKGKVVLSVSSAGGAVGTSSLLQIQALVRNVHGINCPEWISIGGADRNFNSDGEPEQLKIKTRVLKAVDTFIQLAVRVKG